MLQNVVTFDLPTIIKVNYDDALTVFGRKLAKL